MTERLPVYVVTGFLGAGKTTLLNRLVADPAMADAVVIVNEFGEIGLDHLLIDTAIDDAVLLRNGCLCCTVRGDLIDTLTRLAARRDGGDMPPFGRVVIETTGVADPVPVLQAIVGEPAVAARFALGAVIAVVGAPHGADDLDRHEEAARQVAVADAIVLSKVDLAEDSARDDITRRLRALNPTAAIHRVVNGRIAPAVLLRPVFRRQPGGEDGTAASDHRHAHHRDALFESFTVAHDGPMAWEALANWIESVLSLRGGDVLRVKGLANIGGIDRPVVLQGVGHRLYPPTLLDAWPADARGTRIEFICRAGVAASDVRAALAASIADGPRPAAATG